MYYSVEYYDEYDDEEDYYELAETIQNDRAEFYSSYNNMCKINGAFDKFLSKHLNIDK